MTLAVMFAIFLWQWLDSHLQINNMQRELARRLAELDGNNKANQLMMAQEQESTRALSAKISRLEANYSEGQHQRAALEALYQDLSSNRDEAVLAEVEQMLLIAGQQLQLAGNVKAALIAMQQAEERLKRTDRAALSGLRKVISRDIEKLRALPAVDISGINSSLDNLVQEIGALPLTQEMAEVPLQSGASTTVTGKDEGTWRALVREIWADAKHLVRIENMENNDLPLLPPHQVFFLRENLKLRLLSARLALLSHDEVSFKHDLRAAEEWITRYFDTKAAATKHAVNTLSKLRQANISIELPDISASLESARIYRTTLVKSLR